MAITQPTII